MISDRASNLAIAASAVLTAAATVVGYGIIAYASFKVMANGSTLDRVEVRSGSCGGAEVDQYLGGVAAAQSYADQNPLGPESVCFVESSDGSRTWFALLPDQE